VPAAVVVPVYYDFASTICYVAHRVMGRMTADLDALAVRLDWRPLDLTRLTGWPRGAVVAGPRRANALRVASDLGVPVRMPGVWLDSRAAHAVALTLAGTPKEPAWRERVWSAVFEEGCDLGDATLVRLGRDLDLTLSLPPADAALAGVEALAAAAHAAGVTGAPTFMLGPWPCGGIQEERTMRSLLERFVRKHHRAETP
jgi:predicted DsbA family dithiol-disulfide isomerase